MKMKNKNINKKEKLWIKIHDFLVKYDFMRLYNQENDRIFYPEYNNKVRLGIMGYVLVIVIFITIVVTMKIFR